MSVKRTTLSIKVGKLFVNTQWQADRSRVSICTVILRYFGFARWHSLCVSTLRDTFSLSMLMCKRLLSRIATSMKKLRNMTVTNRDIDGSTNIRPDECSPCCCLGEAWLTTYCFTIRLQAVRTRTRKRVSSTNMRSRVMLRIHDAA